MSYEMNVENLVCSKKCKNCLNCLCVKALSGKKHYCTKQNKRVKPNSLDVCDDYKRR